MSGKLLLAIKSVWTANSAIESGHFVLNHRIGAAVEAGESE